VIRRALSKELHIRGSRIIGSYANGTQIAGSDVNQIDIMFVLDNDKHGDWLRRTSGPIDCARYIQERLVQRPEFRDAQVETDNNSVTVRFGKLRFNIVPAFRSEKGLSIPDPSGRKSWITTDPKMFNRIIGHMDRRTKGRMTQIIKVVKGWNDNNGGLLRSFHIENMVYEHFKDRPSNVVSSMHEDVLNFFVRLPTYIQNPTKEPVHGERVDGYLDGNRTKAIGKALRTVDRLNIAEEQMRHGRDELALEYYKKVFGERFSQ
jgi:hypothetical protein